MGTIEGMFHDDITFCPEQCDRKDCMRNSKNIRDKTVPHSYYTKRPDECPKRYITEPVNGVSDVFIRRYGGGTNTRLIDIAGYDLKEAEIQWTTYGANTVTIHRKKTTDLPTVDAVPVVRCADCKYYSGAKDKQGDYTAIGYCKHTSHHIMPLRYDFYCADGERKKDD